MFKVRETCWGGSTLTHRRVLKHTITDIKYGC